VLQSLGLERKARPRVRASEIIGRRIVSGDLAPGSTLPNLDQLASALSTSRLSIREEIKVLVGKGLVSSTPRRGTVVRPRDQWSRLDADVLSWQIGEVPNAAFVRNLFEMRRLIEPEAAAMVATRATREAVAEVERALARMAAAESRTAESIKADLDFHHAMLRGTGNEFIAAFGPIIETSLMTTFRIQRDAWSDPKNFVPSHAAIVDAIVRGDADDARRTTLSQLEKAEADAMDGIRLKGTGAPATADASR